MATLLWMAIIAIVGLVVMIVLGLISIDIELPPDY
jgi:hypothetical protein